MNGCGGKDDHAVSRSPSSRLADRDQNLPSGKAGPANLPRPALHLRNHFGVVEERDSMWPTAANTALPPNRILPLPSLLSQEPPFETRADLTEMPGQTLALLGNIS